MERNVFHPVFNLIVRSFRNSRKASLLRAYLSCFTASANELYIFDNVNIYCAYPEKKMSKSSKQLLKCLKRTKESAVLISFLWYPLWCLCLYCYRFLPSLNRNLVPEKIYLGQWPNTTKIYPVKSNLAAQIKPVQDKNDL
jgi:hypothetical protein